MLRLPTRIDVQLYDTAAQPLNERDILIAVNLLVEGQYYYGNLIGLTDDNGLAKIEGIELEMRFIDDRLKYPMDYKVDINDCDEMIELLILSAEEVEVASDAISAQGSPSSHVRASYSRARNWLVAPGLARIAADSPNGEVLRTILTTRRK